MNLKVCGMKYVKNIQEVAALQPDFLGFIFYEKSKRNFEGIIPQLDKKIQKVGVFVNEYLEILVSLVEEYQLSYVQLHGDEDVSYIKQLKTYLPKLKIIKVFSVLDTFDFQLLEPYLQEVDYFLFDTKGEERGGNGVKFNWDILQNYPYQKPYFLSGGIGFEDVKEINQFLKSESANYCFALDVNSKFEIEPGLKNIEKLKKFKMSLTI